MIQNKIPRNSGTGNINLQLKSTSAGIELAKSEGIKYTLKTRTDCRIYKPNTFDYLESFLKTFPLHNKNFDGSYLPKSRIIATSIATCKFRIYGLTDICLFGHTSDIYKYFFFENEHEILARLELNDKKIINNTAIKSEMLLCIRYLAALNHSLKWSLDDWWFVLKEYFGIITSSEIDFFWKKYNWNFEQKLSRSFTFKSHRLVENSDWIALQSGKKLNWQKLDYQEKWSFEDGKFYKKSIY